MIVRAKNGWEVAFAMVVSEAKFSAEVEVLLRSGGHRSRARLAADWDASRQSPSFELAIDPAAYPNDSHGPVVSLIDARELLNGIPGEFLSEVRDEIDRWKLSTRRKGLLVLSAGAYDPVESNAVAFRRATGLVLAMLGDDVLPTEESVGRVVESWAD